MGIERKGEESMWQQTLKPPMPSCPGIYMDHYLDYSEYVHSPTKEWYFTSCAALQPKKDRLDLTHYHFDLQ